MRSEVMAMHTNRTENAWKESERMGQSGVRRWLIMQHTHQSFVFERVVHGPQKQPERPEELESELQHKISDYHNDP